MDAIQHLARLRSQEERLAVGLMSGMSGDGLDLALVRLVGLGRRPRVELLASRTENYPGALRARIHGAADATTPEVCALGFELANLWAGHVRTFLEAQGVAPEAVDVLASHGQTLCHLPPGGDATPSTLQVGDGDVLAECTGFLTVSDFRPRDMAAGGHGAPLVPFADWVLFAEAGRAHACVNLGSIANVTVVTERLDDVWAFDTGPANALIDGVVRIRTGDAEGIDRDGAMSRRGSVHPGAMGMLEARSAPFLDTPPPRSAGYQHFGPALAEAFVAAHPEISTEDLVRTAVAFTAGTLASAVRRWILPRSPGLEVLRLSGGGAHNPVLVESLRSALAPLGVALTCFDAAWIDAKEAVAFAILGDATARGIPAGVPGATGARHPTLLGKISLGSAKGVDSGT